MLRPSGAATGSSPTRRNRSRSGDTSNELKRDYQRWQHERDRERPAYDGRPDRNAREIEEWARDHHLPYFDEQVHFPDVRIEYESSMDATTTSTSRSSPCIIAALMARRRRAQGSVRIVA
jgi:hypothetical protein